MLKLRAVDRNLSSKERRITNVKNLKDELVQIIIQMVENECERSAETQILKLGY